MPRIPYLTDDEAGDTPLVAAIRQRRGGGLLNLDRELLHSPAFAEGWNTLLGTVRSRLSVDPRLRELAMLVVAVLTDCEYEVFHHTPALAANGGTDAQIVAVRAMKTSPLPHDLFDEREHATIALAFQMTTQAVVDEATFESLEQQLTRTALVELIGVVAAFNMVTRFVGAIGVEPER